jgi:hypothetical protein
VRLLDRTPAHSPAHILVKMTIHLDANLPLLPEQRGGYCGRKDVFRVHGKNRTTQGKRKNTQKIECDKIQR